MAKKRFDQEELTGPPPEPKGMLGKAASVGLSGLQYAGNLLGTPGAVVLNTLGGKDPLAPVMHPLSGEGRISGRDFLRQQGLVGKKDTWGNFGAGLAVDIATDPLTYLTLGGSAVTKAGKAAKAIGAIDKAGDVATMLGRQSGRIGATQSVGGAAARARTTLKDLLNYGDDATKAQRYADLGNYLKKTGTKLDDIIDQRLGGVANIGLPGMPKYTLGASDAGAKFIEGTGKAAMAIPGMKPLAWAAGEAKRGVKGLFHGPSGGRFDEYGQKISELADQHLHAGKRRAAQKVMDTWNDLNGLYKKYEESVGGAARAVRPAGSAFAAGDTVKALDRGNFGRVTEVTPDGVKVHFTEPSTGGTAEKVFPTNMLEMAKETDIPAEVRHMHNPVYRTLDRIVRLTAESKNVDVAIGRLANDMTIPDEVRQQVKKLADDMKNAKDYVWNSNLEMGGKGSTLDESDFFAHFPRYNTPRKTGVLDMFRQLHTGHPSAKGREEITRRLFTETVNQIGMNEKYRSEDIMANARNILQDFEPELGYVNKKGEQVDKVTHAMQLAEHAEGIGKDWMEQQKRLFDNTTPEDLGKYLLAGEKRNASFRAMHEAFHLNLVDLPPAPAVAAADDVVAAAPRAIDPNAPVPLEAAFRRSGLDPERAIPFFQKISGLTPEQLATKGVPSKLVDAASAVIKTTESPQWAGVIAKTLDTVNRYFKPGMVLVKPAFWVRNHTSGQFANLVSGYVSGPGDVADYMSSYKQARDLRISRNQALHDELKIMGVMGADSSLDANAYVLGGMSEPFHNPLPPNMFDIGASSREVKARMTAQPNPKNPLAAGIANATAGIRHKGLTWMETNAKANRIVEYQNRVSLYLYLKKKGYAPEAAAQAVREVHFDYSKDAMSPFEREVMQRVVPFYAFSKGNIPWTVQRLLEKPGGGLAQAVRAIGRGHADDEYTPDYISETAAVPLGQGEDGSARFLTGFGLGLDDATSFATPNLQQLGLEAISRTNPLIKGPLEYAFGQSAFQKGPRGGRELEDLDPVLGRTIANIGNLTGLRESKDAVKYPGSGIMEHVLSNSPLSGVMTSLRTLTDTRKSPVAKAVNLGTGFRVTDVSPAAQDRELMNRIAQIERKMGGRTYQLSYIPKEKKADMTPEEQRNMKMLAELKKLLAERSKTRKKEAAK